MNVSNGSPEARLWLLERIIKDIYGADKLEYRFHNEDEADLDNSHGFLTIVGINENNFPRVTGFVDDGLSGELSTSMGKTPDWLVDIGYEEMEAILNYEVWFTVDSNRKIEKLEAKIKELEKNE